LAEHDHIKIGTCAWSYEDWREPFYPPHLPSNERLEFYSRFLRAVEIDSTFYHSPAEHVSDHWRAATPAEFLFTAKMPREITHDRKLRDSEELLDTFLRGIRPLREKLACVLIQLPPWFEPKHDETALKDFVRQLPREFRFAVEFRDPEWHMPRFVHLLEENHVCWVWNDTTTPEHSAEAAFGFLPPTTDFLYVRLLGDLDNKYDGNGQRIHSYRKISWPRDAALDLWAEKIRQISPQMKNVFVFSGNHFEGFAPLTCQRFAKKLGLKIDLPSRDEVEGKVARDDPQMELL
jgi:uncharacterized protein YecE (DUF72 family)